VKRGDEVLIWKAVTLVRGNVALRKFVDEAVLVPCPRSAPLVRPDALWPGRAIAAALVGAGVGSEVQLLLRRTKAVPKSAFQGVGGRPNAETHFDTIKAERGLLTSPARIVVVDDFVTKGNTLLAVVSRAKEAFPDSEVTAFALVRTLGLQPDVERIVEPCFGRIRDVGGEADREP